MEAMKADIARLLIVARLMALDRIRVGKISLATSHAPGPTPTEKEHTYSSSIASATSGRPLLPRTKYSERPKHAIIMPATETSIVFRRPTLSKILPAAGIMMSFAKPKATMNWNCADFVLIPASLMRNSIKNCIASIPHNCWQHAVPMPANSMALTPFEGQHMRSRQRNLPLSSKVCWMSPWISARVELGSTSAGLSSCKIPSASLSRSFIMSQRGDSSITHFTSTSIIRGITFPDKNMPLQATAGGNREKR
mmetsp:Transcript_11834/g.22662  ORF Transcript_11834/g.22662 Transcript_11834/m.22662 type:complete len:252 (-) Transcript_11834:458-1213(-)